MSEAPIDGRLDEVLRALSARIRRLREERGLTVPALAFEAGLSESRVRAIESGRTTASLATLVALAETFEIEVSALFGDTEASPAQSGFDSPYVVPSEVVWGGELPPAPWLTTTPAAPAASPYVVASDVVWGGELPAAPWTSAVAAAEMPAFDPVSAPADASFPRTEHTWSASVPPVSGPEAAALRPPDAAPAASRPPVSGTIHESAATQVHRRAAEQGMQGASRYVFVAPGTTGPKEPRTFSDLREGPLAGRAFRSLREFAVASVVEGEHSITAVARVFRVPVWRLEQWVTEAGYIGR
ncbi:helix-turn-helix transcriptional regulator [uncultured Microbacterium sp.]|uniref:helix-turn-helix domain-containing protein n=1 Tax=uncultured Microbacterium sp. TaxID=191216 RepID=UPI0025FC3769|nr:helix-turn-helix transcriptional regulator [uncultured Microbacterium sp.]